MFERLLNMTDPSMKRCSKCVGTGIDEVGIAAQKVVCFKCDGKGFIKKSKKERMKMGLKENIRNQFPDMHNQVIDDIVQIVNKTYDDLKCADCGSKEIIHEVSD